MEEIFEKKPVKIVEIPLMTAGLCGYGDSGNVYIKDSTMYEIMPKLLGISVIVTHQGQEAVGEVVEVFQNPNDTDQWIGKLSVRTEEARSLLEDGWGVSTAYRITRDTGVSGKWNNIDYVTEVQDVDWLHVAIVENPRYTIAKDGYFLNSKNDNIVYSQILKKEKERKFMFNLFKTKKEKINLNDGEKIYVRLNDQDVELSDIIEKVKLNEEEEKKKYADDDMMVEINGESITVKELIEKYNACGKKNEDDEDKKEDKENACGKKNEEEKEIEVKEEEKKENEEDKDEDKKDNEEDKEDKKENEDEDKKDNEEDKDEDKKENEDAEDKKEDEGHKEIKNSIDIKKAYLNRGSDVAQRIEYLTTKEKMELANKKYGSNK